MGAMLVGMGPLYAALFNVPMGTFFPHLAMGLVFWMFISGTINESCGVFTQSASYLKHADTPLSLFVWRMVARQLVQLAHQALLYLPIAWWAGIKPSVAMLQFIPGMLLLVLNLHFIALTLGIICPVPGRDPDRGQSDRLSAVPHAGGLAARQAAGSAAVRAQ